MVGTLTLSLETSTMKHRWTHNLIKTSCGIILSLIVPLSLQAKTKSVRKTQEVNFGEMSLKGTVRNPEGAYLVQKRGIHFMPLHDIQKDLDTRIRESVQEVR
jgi:hypothetical protein